MIQGKWQVKKDLNDMVCGTGLVAAFNSPSNKGKKGAKFFLNEKTCFQIF